MPVHKQVLVVAAHPDDEVLGCGGTMARLAHEGCEVNIAILGEGITSRHGQREARQTRRTLARCISRRMKRRPRLERKTSFFSSCPIIGWTRCLCSIW